MPHYVGHVVYIGVGQENPTLVQEFYPQRLACDVASAAIMERIVPHFWNTVPAGKVLEHG
jgi:hypothetical protein